VGRPSALANVVRAFFADDRAIGEDLMGKPMDMLFSTEVGEGNYPGDYVESPKRPYVVPGSRGF